MSRLVRLALVPLALLAVLACTSRPIHAADPTVIVIGGIETIRIRAEYGGRTAAQRADAMRQRLLEIYQAIGQSQKALAPDEVTIDLQPGAPSIRVRGMLLLTVTPADAKINGYTTMEELAKVWLARLRDALVKGAPLPDSQLEYPSPDAQPEATPQATPQQGQPQASPTR